MENVDAQLLTIGYGNRKFEDFILLLQKYKVEVLLDIRSNPTSRFNPSFRKSSLESNLFNYGIQYHFLGNQLGGKPQNKDLYDGELISFERIKGWNEYKAGILYLKGLIYAGVKVTLMCAELDQNQCHRKTLVSQTLSDTTDIKIFHINKQGNLEVHQKEKSLSLFS